MPNSNIPKIKLFGMEFSNPVGLAAGFDKNAEVFDIMSCFGFSFIEIGTVTPLPQPGNPKPRLFRLKKDQALINRMGFNNYGVDFAKKKLSKKNNNLIVGGNIGKNTLTPNELALTDYEYCFHKLYQVVDYFSINVSCPNIKDLRELQNNDSLQMILSRLKSVALQKPKYKPILLKISPDLNHSQIDDSIKIIQETGIDGIIAVNTTTARENLISEKKKIYQIGNGGLSGKPLLEKSIHLIKYIYEKTEGKIPIIGVGGIVKAEDAIDMLNAGASLVQVYSGFIYEGPSIVKKINRAITKKIKL